MKTLKNTNFIAYSEWMSINDKSVDEVSYGSKYKAWFKCCVCQYEWQAAVYNRSNGKGCPACSNRVVVEKNSLAVQFPNLLREWIDVKSPYKFTIGSNIVIKWKCYICKHVWKARIVDRVNGHGCASCAGQVVNKNNRLTNKILKSVVDWDYNLNSDKPESYAYKSNKRVFWKCCVCQYGWNDAIVNYSASGCPKCSGKTIPNNINCLKNDPLMKFWSNKNKVSPAQIHKRSGKKIWWLCKKCKYEWKQSPHALASMRGCPNCDTGSRVSKMALEWLRSTDVKAIPEQLIRVSNNKKIWVDGYNYSTNTAYEFFGDYWHGNPEVYNGQDKNATNGKYFLKLYQETLERISLIKLANINIVYIWEKEWKKTKGNL